MASKTTSKAGSAAKNKRTSKVPAARHDGAVMVPAPSALSPTRSPTHDEIAFRAFELYQLRAHTEGGALNDWLAAESELRAS
jgi:hypothetical protein